MSFLKSYLQQGFKQATSSQDPHQFIKPPFEEVKGKRSWEDYYRRRWQYDKTVRSTHGVNCTGSCSYDVFVKDGIIVWEAQKNDYPTPHPDFPDYEPRGCPRGVSASWYVYSPLRVKYPYVRDSLLKLWRDAKTKCNNDAVSAWEYIQSDESRRSSYQKERGLGGFVRSSWDECVEIICASLIYTAKKYGPDRVFGFTPLPAMSMAGFASGCRFLTMYGASMVSFYDWYCDLPPASPQIWGDQTDVPESADWYNAGYLISWGSNLPQTRTPDAHFYSEARYRGTKVTAISPDYADFTKFADHWLPVRAGTDSALAMAMGHVILNEYYFKQRVEYFEQYVKQFTDMPFLLFLDPTKIENVETFVSGRFLTASDLGKDGKNTEWKYALYNGAKNSIAFPNGSIGSRYAQEDGKWNLLLEDVFDGEKIEPILSFEEIKDSSVEWVQLSHPVFINGKASYKKSFIPAIKILVADNNGTQQERYITTVFDTLSASYGIDRGHGGEVVSSYEDASAYPSPAWQEAITGVNAKDMIEVAREFATNAQNTKGRSMIIMGAGINHWYNNDTTYRAIISLLLFCGTQGVSGGGWAHYVGQEKVRPLSGWTTVTMGTDWGGPPRLQNGTSYYYFALDSWRHEILNMKQLTLEGSEVPEHLADCNALAARLGWLPFFPQFKENSLDTCDKAIKDGAKSDDEIAKHTLERILNNDLELAVDHPDDALNAPRVMLFWRANPLGSNVKGHEYFLKYLLGTKNALLGDDGIKPQTINTQNGFLDKDGNQLGKLDLIVDADLRMNTTCIYSDIVLPSAHWYEQNDISSTDMHPFVHPFTAATDPAWEAKTNWEQFDQIAKTFEKMAQKHLGVRKDIVTVALMHDSPAEIGQPFGEVHDWRKDKSKAVPGKGMFGLKVVERDYTNIYKKFSSLGPNVTKPHGVGAKGASWSCEQEYELLKSRLGTVTEEGISKGMPRIDCSKDACEIMLTLSPETNGKVGIKSWANLEKLTGFKLSDLSAPIEDSHMTFESITARPQKGFTSPNWSGIETHDKTYSAFELNISRKVPFHTLTGRQHFYLDHQWMRDFGEATPTYKPPLSLASLGEVSGSKIPNMENALLLNFLSPHSKWSIHSSYSDNLIMRLLSRGGGEIWLNDTDANSIGLHDNDWLECFNANGVFMGRAVISHRIPKGKTYIYHAQERLINVPLSPISKHRAGTHNSLTRPIMKPTQMIGGYGQLSYFFNYYGPTGCQRDEFVIVRKLNGKVEF